MLRNTAKTFGWIIENSKGFKLKIFLLTLLISLTSLSSVAIAIISKKLVDAATAGNKSLIYGLLVVFIIFALSDIISGAIVSFFNLSVWQNLSIKLRLKLYNNLVNSSWLEFSRLHTGDYVSRFTQDAVTVTSGIVDDIPEVLSAVVKLVAAFAVLAYYQPIIALITFVFGPVAFIITRIYSHKLKELYKSAKAVDSEINGRLQEFFQNVQVIKAFQLQELSGSILKDVYLKRKSIVMKRIKISNIIGIIKSLGTWGGYFFAYSIGIFGILNNQLSFGVLVVFLQLFNQIQEPLSGIAGSIPTMMECLASAERLIEINSFEKDDFTVDLVPPSKLSIRIEDVSFSYPQRENQFNNINFHADNGEVVLIMGKSGSGKTTLVRLILSLVNPHKGRILYIDEKGDEVLANADNRAWISYVPQGNSLFSGSIASNVRLGNPEITDDEIVSALASAEAWSFVSELKEGINTVIGERGLGISEGQAQRIAIARAFVHKAPAVVFDEATSGLDAETERKIMENIRNKYSDKTFIIITHRDSVRKYSHRAYRFQNGAFMEEEVHN